MAKLCVVAVLAVGFFCVGGLKIEGGQLRAEQEPEAWWDESSRQWFIRLTCGTFTFIGSPPLNVTWTTPQGEAKFSSGYNSGRFYLNLDAPVHGGNYTCEVPAHHLPLVCDEDEDNVNASAGSADVELDEVKARLALAEANQKALKTMLETLAHAHAEDMGNVTQFCQDIQKSVETQGEIIQNIQQSLMEQEDQNRTQAELTGPCEPDLHTVLDDAWRAANMTPLGERYRCDKKMKPGWYRFLIDGRNAVIPTECVEEDRCTTHAPQWLDLRGEPLPEVGQETKGRACASWSGTCCNWVSPITVRNCGEYFVYKLQPGNTCNLAYCSELQSGWSSE